MTIRTISTATLLTISAGLAAPIAAADELPLRRVTIYRSGVAAFERTGEVAGAAEISITADDDRINDLLKSLVVLDPQGRGSASVSYAAEDPLARRLASLGLSASNISGITSLFRQLTGEPVTIEAGGETISGTVIGTANRQLGDGSGAEAVSRPFVTVMTGTGVRAIDTWAVRSLTVENESLRRDLEQSLGLLAESRADEGRAVEIELADGPEREASIFYVQESPVWKTSYRLVIPENGRDPFVQAWAVVENTTSEDWDNVELSLAAGQPIGFRMDLRTPLYKPRRELPVPIAGAAAPVDIAAGRGSREEMKEALAQRRQRLDSPELGVAADAAAPAAMNAFAMEGESMGTSAAASVEAGDAFFFTVEGPVDVRAGGSTMLPIIARDLEGERVSFYSSNMGGRPMRAVMLVNDSGTPLPPGPVAVYEAGRYAGDGSLSSLPVGLETMVAYAVDDELSVTRPGDESAQRITSVRIVNGLLEQTLAERSERVYELDNADDRRRVVVIEEPMQPGWELENETSGAAPGVERFRVEVAADASETFSTVRTRTRATRIGLASADLPAMVRLARTGAVSDAVLDAIREAARLNAAVTSVQREIREMEQARQTAVSDQARYRENLRATRQGTDLHERYLRLLGESEDAIAGIEDDLDGARERLRSAERALADYVNNLNVR